MTIDAKTLDSLQVGDVLLSSSGRTYTVTDVNAYDREVSYAFIPAHSHTNEIRIDTRSYGELNWVDKVKRGTTTVWPTVIQRGDKVKYDGREWTVETVSPLTQTLVLSTKATGVYQNRVERI